MVRRLLPVLSAVVLFLILNPSAFAARGRGVRPSIVSLNGSIVEAGTGAPGFRVQVTVQNQTITSGKDGSYEFTNLTAGQATITFERFGYVTVTRSVDLRPGFNGLNLTVQAKPVITVTDTKNVVHVMDYETSDFASLFPFTSPEVLPSIEFCRTDSSKFQVAKSEFKTVTGPGLIISGPACCPGSSGTQITFETKTPGSSTSGIVSDCKYYHVIFQGLNRQTGLGESFDLPAIVRMVFP